MSVYTAVSFEQLAIWLENYPLGKLTNLQGIASGITNTNFFVTTEQGRFVLTLFEHLKSEELPYFLNLMGHLADNGILCPHPVANDQGDYLGHLNGKPAALVSCLRGKSIEHPTPLNCEEVGKFLARLHLVGQDYPNYLTNPRGPNWWNITAKAVLPILEEDDRALLENELAHQARYRGLTLPTGVIHADLFRDNVLFDGDILGGAIDFYYACNDVLAYDLAIAVNDWCINSDGTLDPARSNAMISSYQQVRPLLPEERDAWPDLLRAGALRFWLSRLYDFHFPQPGEMTHAHDPQPFRRILQMHVQHPSIINQEMENARA